MIYYNMEKDDSITKNNLEQEVSLIKQRNQRVETDKVWETSWTRKICIVLISYFVVVCYSFITTI